MNKTKNLFFLGEEEGGWKGVKGRKEERTDTVNVDLSEVTCLCGFWDGSCERGTCGAGIMILVFTKTPGWATIHRKCGAVLGWNSLDAELGGSAMLMNDLSCLFPPHSAFAEECLARGWTVTELPNSAS